MEIDKTIEEAFVDGEVLPEDLEALLLDDGPEDKSLVTTEANTDAPQGGAEPPEGGDDTPAGIDIIDEEAKDEGGSESDQETDKDEETAAAAETDEEVDGTEHYFRGVYWKEQGVIPEDTELKADLTAEGLETIYQKATHDSSIELLKGQVNNRLHAMGVEPDLVWGDKEDTDRQVQRNFKVIGDLSYDDLVERAGDKLQDVLKRIGGEYYFSKLGEGADEDEVNALIDRDVDNNIEEDLFTKYSDYLGKKADEIGERIKVSQETQRKAERKKADENRAYIEKQLSSGKIGNRTYTEAEIKKISDGMYKVNQIYKDPYGGSHKVTLFEKKRLEARDDIDIQLSMATSMILGVNEDTIKEKSERVGSMNTLNRIANAASSATTSFNSIKDKESDKEAEVEGMFLDTD